MDGLVGARVTEMWRYPVKSMRGERVGASDVDASGLRGDRAYAVVDVETGKVGSAKHPRLWADLLGCSARCVGEPAGGAPPMVRITLPDGSETGSDDPDVDERLSSLFGRPVRLVAVAPEGSTYLAVWPDIEGVIPDDFLAQNSVAANEAEGSLTDIGLALAAPGTFFDVSALHVVTEATLRHLGELAPESTFAVERYRPNLVLDTGDEPFLENGWAGGTVTVGGALQAMVLLPTMRCIMTTLAQGDLPRDANVLRTVATHNRIELPGLGTWSCVGAYAAVTAPGPVQVGDTFAAP
jgi:uncharacterized protein